MPVRLCEGNGSLDGAARGLAGSPALARSRASPSFKWPLFAGSDGAATGLEIALGDAAQSYPVQRHISPGDIAKAAKMLRTTKPRPIPIVPRWRCKVVAPRPTTGGLARSTGTNSCGTELTSDTPTHASARSAPAALVPGRALPEIAHASPLASRNISKY